MGSCVAGCSRPQIALNSSYLVRVSNWHADISGCGYIRNRIYKLPLKIDVTSITLSHDGSSNGGQTLGDFKNFFILLVAPM